MALGDPSQVQGHARPVQGNRASHGVDPHQVDPVTASRSARPCAEGAPHRPPRSPQARTSGSTVGSKAPELAAARSRAAATRAAVSGSTATGATAPPALTPRQVRAVPPGAHEGIDPDQGRPQARRQGGLRPRRIGRLCSYDRERAHQVPGLFAANRSAEAASTRGAGTIQARTSPITTAALTLAASAARAATNRAAGR